MKTAFILVFTLFFVSGSIAQNLDNNIVLYSITEANGLSDDHVQCVLKDKDGFLWIGTADGLNEMDGSSITVFRHHDNDSTSIINNNVLSLCEDDKGNIWAGTATGLSYFDKQQKQFISATPAASPYGSAFFINCIVIDRQQRIWCSTDGGLFLFDPTHRSFRPFYNTANKQNNSSCNRLTHIISDREEDKLWLATGDGLWSLDLRSFNYKEEISEKNDPGYKELFTYVYEGNDKKIWVGNWGNGLEQFDPFSGKVIHYGTLPLHPDVVKCITEVQQADGKNVLWLDGKFLAFDPLNGQFFNYSIASQNAETSSVFPCYRSVDGWTWLASSQGLYVYNPNRQFFQHHLFPKTITSQGVVFSEWDHSLLTGGQFENFLKLYDNNWNLKRSFDNVFVNEGKKLPGAALLSLTVQQNTFWVGTDEGIAKIDANTNKVRWFQHKVNDSTSPPRNFITDIFFDSKKILWFFPWREGIWTMDTATGKCRQLWKGFINSNGSEKKLLISSAAEDKNGNIWMADLDEGIVLFERNTGRFSKPFVKELGDLVYSSAVFYRDGF
ncbi:MAG TPA: two-component regulator propeller domain-containing protein, partial [Chitinophagaceae bacterium]